MPISPTPPSGSEDQFGSPAVMPGIRPSRQRGTEGHRRHADALARVPSRAQQNERAVAVERLEAAATDVRARCAPRSARRCPPARASQLRADRREAGAALATRRARSASAHASARSSASASTVQARRGERWSPDRACRSRMVSAIDADADDHAQAVSRAGGTSPSTRMPATLAPSSSRSFGHFSARRGTVEAGARVTTASTHAPAPATKHELRGELPAAPGRSAGALA